MHQIDEQVTRAFQQMAETEDFAEASKRSLDRIHVEVRGRNATRSRRSRAWSWPLVAAASLVFAGVAIAAGTDLDRPILESLGVFREDASDATRSETNQIERSIAPYGLPDQLGRPLPSSGRSLLDTVINGRRVQIRALSTDSGNICYRVRTFDTSDGAGACLPTFLNGWPVSQTDSSGGRALHGIVADQVKLVRVTTADGNTTEATMGVNAYYWESATSSFPSAIEVVLRDGTVIRRGIASPAERAMEEWRAYRSACEAGTTRGAKCMKPEATSPTDETPYVVTEAR